MSKSEQARRQATGVEGTITVSATQFNQVSEEKEYIEIRPFATVPAKVGVKFGRTLNLGNYESARVDVLIEMPCYAEEAKRVYQEVLDMAQARIAEEVDKITKSMHGEQSVEELL
ncbi:MAG: hypothetical protein IJU37_10690 [Desulfovibrio sp.]|nr:hypothetical protein [Desulfovibrio sp.]